MKKLTRIFITLQILCCGIVFSQNRIVFEDNFENPTTTIANWGPATNYTVVSGFSGNGVTVNGTSSISIALLTKTIPIDSIRGKTISLSAMLRGQNIKSNCHCTGLKLYLELTDNNNQLVYADMRTDTGTFNWQNKGQYFVIDSNITQATLNIGIKQGSGDAWFDNVKIEAVDNVSKMPPARNPLTPIDKGHNLGMSRGMSLSYQTTANLDELSYNWKADHIRYGTNFNLSDPNYNSLVTLHLKQLDSMIMRCKANKLRMVVMHGLEGLFSNKANQDKFINTWKQIALKCKDDSTIWGYDLANEPTYLGSGWPNDGYLLYNNLMDTLVREIRKIDTVKTIMIECMISNLSFTSYRRIDGFDNFRPIDPSIPNIAYSFHMYEPWTFTHQTLYGNVVKYPFPCTIGGKYYDKAELKNIMKPIKDFQDKYRVPIFVGEFSAIRWALNNGSYHYIRDCIELFEENRWDWSFHTFREYHGWSTEHSTDSSDVTPTAEPTSREDLLRYYFGKKEVGIKTNYFDNANYSVYPNPTENKLTIEIKNQKTESLHLKLINSNGQTLIEETARGSFLQKEYNLEIYPKGIYFLQIISNNNTSGKKIILE